MKLGRLCSRSLISVAVEAEWITPRGRDSERIRLSTAPRPRRGAARHRSLPVSASTITGAQPLPCANLGSYIYGNLQRHSSAPELYQAGGAAGAGLQLAGRVPDVMKLHDTPFRPRRGRRRFRDANLRKIVTRPKSASEDQNGGDIDPAALANSSTEADSATIVISRARRRCAIVALVEEV